MSKRDKIKDNIWINIEEEFKFKTEAMKDNKIESLRCIELLEKEWKALNTEIRNRTGQEGEGEEEIEEGEEDEEEQEDEAQKRKKKTKDEKKS